MINNKDIIGFADDKYIVEASPQKVKKQKRNKNLKAAACVAAGLLLALNLWLFIPIKGGVTYNAEKHKDSPYYEVISAINSVVNYNRPTYRNNFEAIISSSDFLYGLFDVKDNSKLPTYDGNNGADYPTKGDYTDGTGNYQEVTDNQVADVVEEDLFKRSDRYIYYLDDGTLRIYSIEKEASREVGNYPLSEERALISQGIYLSEDCKTVTVILNDSYRKTIVTSIDVTDPTAPRQKSTVAINGNYHSSRVIDGELFIISTFHLAKGENFANRETYLPSIDLGQGMCYIPPEDIVIPDKVTNGSYTVISRFDQNTLEKKDCAAFLSYTTTVYVSNNTLYLTNTYQENGVTHTEVTAVSFLDDKFEIMGSQTVKGQVNDQYSLDEYNGVLRVVTTTNGKKGSNASLYCIALDNYQVISSVENFAPYGETVRSVRFDKENAYVCTAIRVTDPVFFFDLSDYHNITYKQTDDIEGFSSSLSKLGDGYLLGIGRSTSSVRFKLEIYKEGESKIDSVCKFELDTTSFSSLYKAYYIDRQNMRIGTAVAVYNPQKQKNEVRYLLLEFDGKELNVISDVELVTYLKIDYTIYGICNAIRATVIDGYLYVLSPDQISVIPVANGESPQP